MKSPGIAGYTESYWHYNDRVHMRYALAMVVVSAGMLAQSKPPSCPADRPVGDIIAAINKQQSNKANRITNPLPISEVHTSELQSHLNIVCFLLLEKKQLWNL